MKEGSYLQKSKVINGDMTGVEETRERRPGRELTNVVEEANQDISGEAGAVDIRQPAVDDVGLTEEKVNSSRKEE